MIYGYAIMEAANLKKGADMSETLLVQDDLEAMGAQVVDAAEAMLKGAGALELKAGSTPEATAIETLAAPVVGGAAVQGKMATRSDQTEGHS